MNPCEFLFETLSIRGESRYGMEKLNQMEHALQCAALAERDGATSALIVAALLHDIGHLIDDSAFANKGETNDEHESKGADVLAKWFGKEVSEPVRLHVPAKRYLCTTDGDYHDGLSRASQRSLALQGSAFSEEEADAFILQPYAVDAVCLRRWDDHAKVADLNVPRLEHYRPYVEGMLVSSNSSAAASV